MSVHVKDQELYSKLLLGDRALHPDPEGDPAPHLVPEGELGPECDPEGDPGPQPDPKGDPAPHLVPKGARRELIVAACTCNLILSLITKGLHHKSLY